MKDPRQNSLDATAAFADECDDQDDLAASPGRYDYLAQPDDCFVRLSMKNERSPRRMRDHY